MPTYDIIHITRTRLRYSVMADTMEDAKRVFLETGGDLRDDETLEVLAEHVIAREGGTDVTEAWDAIEIDAEEGA